MKEKERLKVPLKNKPLHYKVQSALVQLFAYKQIYYSVYIDSFIDLF
jgi:hypothetical protein